MSYKADTVYESKALKKEVVSAFLSVFTERGLSETSVRDLSFSITQNSGGLYTYFKSKEEAIIACADEAAARLEQGLIIPALKETDDLDALLTKTLNRADKYMPEMKLLVQVSTTPKYSEMMKPTLNRLCERYRIYTEKFAAKLNCKPEELAPYVYMCITAYTNYMTFGTKEYILPQLEIVKQAVEKMKNSKENTHEKDV